MFRRLEYIVMQMTCFCTSVNPCFYALLHFCLVILSTLVSHSPFVQELLSLLLPDSPAAISYQLISSSACTLVL